MSVDLASKNCLVLHTTTNYQKLSDDTLLFPVEIWSSMSGDSGILQHVAMLSAGVLRCIVVLISYHTTWLPSDTDHAVTGLAFLMQAPLILSHNFMKATSEQWVGFYANSSEHTFNCCASAHFLPSQVASSIKGSPDPDLFPLGRCPACRPLSEGKIWTL